MSPSRRFWRRPLARMPMAFAASLRTALKLMAAAHACRLARCRSRNKIRRTRASYDEAELEVAAAVTQGEAASSQGSAPAAEPASPDGRARRTRRSSRLHPLRV